VRGTGTGTGRILGGAGKRMPSPCPSSGFTLLEVLISIVILVMAIAAIIPLFAVGSTSHKRGMDQAQVAWLAPRIAARMQERLYDANPKDVRGYVRELEDGSLLIDDLNDKLDPKQSGDYLFEAKFTPLASGAQSDPSSNSAFVLRVEVHYREFGSQIVDAYETVVLRKLLR
jgi:prepilin-type N-terminal cleavage/methylation domain-containing protein